MEGKRKRGVPVPVAGWPRQAGWDVENEMWGDAVVSVGLAGVRGLWGALGHVQVGAGGWPGWGRGEAVKRRPGESWGWTGPQDSGLSMSKGSWDRQLGPGLVP